MKAEEKYFNNHQQPKTITRTTNIDFYRANSSSNPIYGKLAIESRLL